MATPAPLSSMRAFQVRLLLGMLGANVFFAALLLGARAAGLISTSGVWTGVVATSALAMGALWWALRRWNRIYVAAALIQNISALALFTYALLQPQGHELRVVWFVIGVGATYVLLGRRAGAAYTAVTLLVVHSTNHLQTTPYSGHALIVFTLAFLLCAVCFHFLVTHALDLYQHLTERDQQFTLLTQGAEEVIWRINPDLTVAYVSPADHRLRGFAEVEVVGRPIQEALAEDGAARLQDALRSAQQLVTLPMRCKTGQVRWFEMSGRQHFDANGNSAGYHSIGRDVTERRALELALAAEREHLEARVQERTAALSVAKEAAEAALRAKRIFLANIGHELRTPMTLVLGMTELAHARVADARIKAQLQTAMTAGRRLMTILSDLIDLAALEARKVDFALAPLSVHAVAARAVALLAPVAQGKGLSVVFAAQSAPGAQRYLGDAGRLEQVLVNLLDNAIKFSNSGVIRLEAEMQEDFGDAPRTHLWTLRVIDQGIGIAAEDQGKLFTLFEQVDGSATRAFEGAGLGLALSKRLVEGMGGHLGVQSEPGRGSCFWFALPLALATEEDEGA